MPKKDKLLTLGQAADRLGVQAWRVGRLFERGFLPQPIRVGQNRVVPASDLPKIKKAMKTAGYLK